MWTGASTQWQQSFATPHLVPSPFMPKFSLRGWTLLNNLFFMLLDAYKQSWKDLRLVLPFSWARVAMQMFSQPTPLLEVFQMQLAKSQDNLLPTSQTSFFLTDELVPCLRCIFWSITGPHSVLFLPQLTHLEELEGDSDLSFSECLVILQQCPRLVSCEFWKIRSEVCHISPR